MSSYRVLSVEADAKTIKGSKQGYLTGILYLAPHTLAGVGNLCPNATAGCIASCLNTAGRGVFTSTQTARIAKTKRFHADRDNFIADLTRDILTLTRAAKRKGFRPVVRLNGTSDLPWENIRKNGVTLFQAFPDVQFYDYTKSARRMASMLHGKVNMVESIDWPSNYHLTFSRSECNEADALRILERGGNVAVVFSARKGEALPNRWQGFAVTNGDDSDLRFLDSPYVRPVYHGNQRPYYGQVIGLYAKGRARKDTSGFVVTV